MVDSTRYQAITRWADVLQDHPEIYVWLSCGERSELDVHMNGVKHAIRDIRTTVSSSADLEILDRTILLLGCHTTGLQLLVLSYGKIQLDGDGFNVKCEDEHDITKEEASEWGIFFRNLLHSLLYVSH